MEKVEILSEKEFTFKPKLTDTTTLEDYTCGDLIRYSTRTFIPNKGNTWKVITKEPEFLLLVAKENDKYLIYSFLSAKLWYIKDFGSNGEIEWCT